LENIAKSKASLTSARSIANTIFVSTNIYAEIDVMNGILYAEDIFQNCIILKLFRYPYFYESFEAFDSQDEK
jgi:26S proteasome regulatory subunit N6